MSNIFWGYILLSFHLRINGFDLLADFAGYYLIWRGLTQLGSRSVSFERAKPWAIALGAVSFLLQLNTLLFRHAGVLIRSVDVLFALAVLYLLYLVVVGIRELEESLGLALGSETFMHIFRVQIVVGVGICVLVLFANPITAFLVLALTLIAFVVYIVFLVHLYRAKKVLDAFDADSTP